MGHATKACSDGGIGGRKNAAALKYIELPKLEIVGNGFLQGNTELKYFDLPNLKFVGDEFWDNKSNLKLVDLPNLKTIGTPLVTTPIG